MRIKNFAIFGLFKDGKMIESGSIHRMENEAFRMIMSGQAEALRISVYGFVGDDITEDTCVLSYRRVGNSIIVANMLAKEDGERMDGK